MTGNPEWLFAAAPASGLAIFRRHAIAQDDAAVRLRIWQICSQTMAMPNTTRGGTSDDHR